MSLKTYLGIQLGGVLSTSHVANSFIGTGFNPTTGGGLLGFSAMLSRTEKNICTDELENKIPATPWEEFNL